MICDLPYGETNCKWDIKIDMEEFWNEFRRIRKSKKTACLHFCSTKFGYQLIKSWEKGFKMDMIWKKRKPVGGITSRSRPMRNHEMIYFFYEESPKYNRDKYHKRIIPKKPKNCKKQKKSLEDDKEPLIDIEETGKFGGVNNCYGNALKGKGFSGKTYKEQYGHCPLGFEPRQPSTIIEEEEKEKYTKEHLDNNRGGAGTNEQSGIFSKENIKKYHKEKGVGFEPKQPVSVIVEDEPVSMFESKKVYIGKRHHSTEKPQDILEFFLKYWSDEGDTVLDPTMGGGSTGVACKKLNRNFIGIELDENIFNVAKNRICKQSN